MIRYLGLWGLLCVLLRCSSGPSPVAGGTVIPNLLVGNVIYEDSRPAIGKEVVLKSIIITPRGDSALTETTTVTDQNGRYTFEGIQKGKYIIYCHDTITNLSVLIPKLDKRTDSTVVAENMVLRTCIQLTGRILSEEGISQSNIQVFIPGITERIYADSNGIYTLQNAPQGHFEIAIIAGNTINYLPITVEKTTAPTIYVRDVEIELQGSNLFNDYSFYDHVLDYSYSILPIGYRADIEPDWYRNKDFSGTQYFSVENNQLKVYDPTHTLLFILGSSGEWLSDDNLINHLEKEMGFSVFVFEHNAISIDDTAGMDIIYISSSITADTLAANAVLREVHQPIVCDEDNYYPVLMMTDSTENVDFGDKDSDGFIKIVDPDHFIAAGLQNYVQVIFNAGYINWGVPGGDVTIIATYPGNSDKALLFCYNTGDEMAGMSAPARRVGSFFVHTRYTVRNLTDDGWKIYEAIFQWALDG